MHVISKCDTINTQIVLIVVIGWRRNLKFKHLFSNMIIDKIENLACLFSG